MKLHTSPFVRAAGATALALGLVLSTQTAAAAAPQTAAPVSPAQTAAMQSAFGLTATEVAGLITAEAEAAEVEAGLRTRLGTAFGGAVFDIDTRELTVQVTDRAVFGTVRSAGAVPQLVGNGEAGLSAIIADLDAAGDTAAASVHGWYADTARDRVVIEVDPGRGADAERLITQAGVDAGAVLIEEAADRPQLHTDLVGGDPYYFQDGGSWYVCSIGFGVEGGYVTAGHCGDTGTDTWYDVPGTQQIGTVAGSVFPRQDSAWVQITSSGFTSTALVGSNSGPVTVTGSQEAPVGASVCRSGRTTGWHCGVIEAKDQTVRYPRGQHVHGLTRTSACAEGGDSGGPFVSGTQAQGVTSGGSGDCTSGGTTYYQPVNPILERWNLTLLTG